VWILWVLAQESWRKRCGVHSVRLSVDGSKNDVVSGLFSVIGVSVFSFPSVLWHYCLDDRKCICTVSCLLQLSVQLHLSRDVAQSGAAPEKEADDTKLECLCWEAVLEELLIIFYLSKFEIPDYWSDWNYRSTKFWFWMTFSQYLALAECRFSAFGFTYRFGLYVS